MREYSIGELINKSIKRTKGVLFVPFSFKKWVKLLFIAWLAGALGTGVGRGSSFNSHKKAKAAPVVGTYHSRNLSTHRLYNASQLPYCRTGYHRNGGFAAFISKFFSSMRTRYLVFGIATLLVIFLLALGILFIFIWLGARFKFVWLEAVVNNQDYIKEPFYRYRHEGNSLFKAMLALSAVAAFLGGLVFAWFYLSSAAAGLFNKGGHISFIKIIGAVIPSLLTFIGILIFFAVLSVIINHFLVPIMSRDRSGFIAGWRNFVRIAKENSKDMVLYIFVVMGLGIISFLIIFGISLIVMVPIVLTGGLLFGLLYLFFVTLLKIKIVYILFAVMMGIPFVIAAIAVMMSIKLPFAVFFRSFSLYFLSSLNCGYNLLPLEEQ